MDLYASSPFRRIVNGLYLTQFALCAILFLKGVITAYRAGNGLFDSIIVGGGFTTMPWMAVPVMLFMTVWWWPRLLGDIYTLLVMPCVLLLMMSIGWNVAGHVSARDLTFTTQKYKLLADELRFNLEKAKQGDPIYISIVRGYEITNRQSYEDYIRDTEAAFQADVRREEEMLNKMDWGSRIIYEICN